MICPKTETYSRKLVSLPSDTLISMYWDDRAGLIKASMTLQMMIRMLALIAASAGQPEQFSLITVYACQSSFLGLVCMQARAVFFDCCVCRPGQFNSEHPDYNPLLDCGDASDKDVLPRMTLSVHLLVICESEDHIYMFMIQTSKVNVHI